MKKLSKWNYFWLTMVCALIVVIGVYILQEVAPFGDNSLLTIDFYHQYGPMLGELYDRIVSKSTLLYSFKMGMGLPFYLNFFNYLSSPFNLILFLFKRSNLLMSYSVIIGLKAVASALSMGLFLGKKFGKNYMFIPLSIFYAFNAYFTAYYWNIMWLDGMVMLPLIVLGIEKLVKDKKCLLYIISLAVMLFANYFIGYMICIFCVLYFIMYLLISMKDKKEFLKKGLYFLVSSLIAGGLCAVFLIPLYCALKGISATSDVWPTSQYYAFSLKDFIFNHFSGVGSTVLKSGITCAPNVSCGVVVVALLLIFFINPKIDLKVKIGYGSLLVILILSFIIAPLDFIWHAFHVPNDLPYRYSFIYSFVLVLIGAYGIKNIDGIKPKLVGIVYIIILGFITMMKVLDYQNISNEMIMLNYVIITIFYLCYVIFVYFNKWYKYAIVFAIFTSVLECVLVINNNWGIDQKISDFYADYDEIEFVLSDIDNSEMYRLEKTYMLSFNDPSWYGYYGQVAFSSMEYENMAVMQYNLGMPGNEINSFYYKQNTPVYDLMFNLEYIIGNSVDSKRYYLYYRSSGEMIYKNNYNVGLMYKANDSIKNWNNNFDNPFKNQNDFIYKASGIANVLEEFENVNSEKVYDDGSKVIVKYKVKNTYDNYYMYFDSYDIDFAVVNGTLYYFNDYYYADEIKEISVDNYVDYNEKYIINEISDEDYIEFYIGYNSYNSDEFYMYKLNEKAFKAAYDYFSDSTVKIDSFKESYITVESNEEEAYTMYSSIPYDEGWRVYIDGEEVDTFDIGNALLGFDVPAGEHKIVLNYNIPYMKIGLVLTSISTLGLVVFKKRLNG